MPSNQGAQAMTITLTREEAQQVLDAFESAAPKYTRARKDGKTLGGALDYWKLEQHKRMPAIETLRARLSAPEPEYRDVVIKGDLWRIEFLPDHAASVVLVRANYEAQPEPEPVACPKEPANIEELYTAPPQREWQGLTDEEVKSAASLGIYEKPLVEFARAIEAKLKEKNASHL